MKTDSMNNNSTAVEFARGLSHCDHQTGLYANVLACYQDEFGPRLPVATLLNDSDAARLQLHTLKSLSATIGAQSLSQMAEQLFAGWATQNPAERETALNQVNVELGRVLSDIEQYKALTD